VAVVVIASLYLARVVFVPLGLALQFSPLLTPVFSFFERIFILRLLAIFLLVVIFLSLATLLGWETSQQFVDLTQQLPCKALSFRPIGESA
jgi:predicted PurR-regulated permease PerM